MDLGLDVDPCSHCGACLSFCAWDAALREGRPAGPEVCRDCQMCYRICPRLSYDAESLAATLFSGAEPAAWGRARGAFSGRAAQRPDGVQDGGLATAIASYLVRLRQVDAVLVTGRDPDWRPQPYWATDEAGVRAACGSKYSTAPALADLRRAEGWSKVAVIALPCQCAALARLRQLCPEWEARIAMVIGLFCSKTFVHRVEGTVGGLAGLVEARLGLPVSEVERFDIRRGRFTARTGEESAEWRMKELADLAWPVCSRCGDLAAEMADISLGSVGSSEGHSSIIVRSARGQALLDAGVEAGLWQLGPIENPEALEKLCVSKRANAQALPEEKRKLYGRDSVRGNWRRRLSRSRVEG